MNISSYFILYMMYSCIGWILEVIDSFIEHKKFVNRGFLIGPYCPIYGKGALLVTFLLQDYLDKPIGLFVLSMVICAIIEYIGSYILEKLFNTSWWDYSHKKFNINGRICLSTMLIFGVGCTIVMYITNPFFIKILSISNNILNILALILAIIYITDFIISFRIIWKFKKISDNSKKDSTIKVTEYVREEIIKKKNILYKRLINAFPNLKVLKDKKEQLWKK